MLITCSFRFLLHYCNFFFITIIKWIMKSSLININYIGIQWEVQGIYAYQSNNRKPCDAFSHSDIVLLVGVKFPKSHFIPPIMWSITLIHAWAFINRAAGNIKSPVTSLQWWIVPANLHSASICCPTGVPQTCFYLHRLQ